MLGRLTLNPLAHIDWIGTVLFPLIAMSTGAPIIGWAKPVPVNMRNLRHPRRDFAIVAVAGPISNLILAVGGAAVLMVIPGGATAMASGTSVASFFVLAVVLNVLLAVFNMIPVPPLDGGNVLAGLVSERRRPPDRSDSALRVPHSLRDVVHRRPHRDRRAGPERVILSWLL